MVRGIGEESARLWEHLGAVSLGAAQGGGDTQAMPNIVKVVQERRAHRQECLRSAALGRVKHNVVHRAPQRRLEVHLLQRDTGIERSLESGQQVHCHAVTGSDPTSASSASAVLCWKRETSCQSP